jgi:hypothetical protein
MNKNLIKCKKNPNDIFYTPKELVKDCIKIVDIVESDILLDPFLGEGAFYNQYPEKNKKFWCEIEKNKDFLKYTDKVDWIISNPPFSKLNIILDHCCLIANKGFGLILLSTALTVPRINRMKEKGFKIVKILFFQVPEWFGFNCIFVLFSKNGNEIFNIEPKIYK